MIATWLPRAIRSPWKNMSSAHTSQSALPIPEQGASKQRDLKSTISKPTPVPLHPNYRPESEASSASGATFETVSERTAADVLIPCGICQKTFDAQCPHMLFAHLGGHFDKRHQFNRCDECEINFVTKDDLREHLHSASQHKTCGFMFRHTQLCAGHHPPRRRELKDDSRFDFCYRLQRWEGTQLEANQVSRQVSAEGLLEVPAASTRTFSMTSIADVMRISRLSRMPKIEDVEQALQGTPQTSPEDALGAALLRAICTAHVDLVACFVDAGANVHVTDALGFGVMHYNAQYGSPEIGLLLMQAGTDPNGTDRRGRTPLAHAISAGNTQLVHWFFAWGAHPGPHDLKDVIDSGHVENAELLLGWWRQQDKPKEALDSLLMLAVNKQDREMVEVLLESGARAFTTDVSGRTALSLAANANDKTITSLLLEYGAEPDDWHQKKDDRPFADVFQYQSFATAEMLCAKAS